MNEQIHQILQKSGVAKGITKQEVMTLFILGNDDLFTSFLEQIKNNVSTDEFEKIQKVFLEEKKNIQQANNEYAKGLEQIVSEVKTDILKDKIKKISQTNPEELELFIKTINSL